jgi:hypothetical protein
MKTQGQIKRKIHPNNRRNQSIKQQPAAKIPRSYGDAVDRDYQALESGIVLEMPGIVCGRKFDVFFILWLLAKVLFNCERTIDIAVSKGSRSQPRFRSAAFKSHDEKERVRSRLEWGQALFLARELLQCAEVSHRDEFNLPFAGLGGTLILSAVEVVEFLAQFLHRHSGAISDSIENSHCETDAELAEALLVAETVCYYLGYETELDQRAGGFLQPTKLQLQAWRIHAAALEQKQVA